MNYYNILLFMSVHNSRYYRFLVSWSVRHNLEILLCLYVYNFYTCRYDLSLYQTSNSFLNWIIFI